MRGQWIAAAVVLVPATCSRQEPPDPAAVIQIEPADVRVDAVPLADTVWGQILPPVPHVAGIGSPLNGQPARLRLRFGHDVLPTAVNPLQRQVLIYPLAAYRALFPAEAQRVLDQRVSTLHRLLAERPELVDAEEIPVLPDPGAPQAFRARIRYLRFDGGAGVAFITRYAPGAPLVWTFQGVTDDGRYWVSAFHPVHAPGLPKTGPADAAARHLEATSPHDFRPSLETLAAVVHTLRVREPPLTIAVEGDGER